MAEGDLIAQTLGQFKPQFNISITAIIYIFLFVAGLMIFYFRFRGIFYPIKVVMRKRTGGGVGWVEDSGIIKMHEGIRKLFLYSMNKYFPVPATSDLLPTKGIFRKYVYEVYLNDNGEIVPVRFDDKDYIKTSQPANQSMQGWAQLQRKRVENNYGDFLSKYGVLVGEGIVALTLIIVSIVIAGKLEKSSELLSMAIRETATILQTMRGGG